MCIQKNNLSSDYSIKWPRLDNQKISYRYFYIFEDEPDIMAFSIKRYNYSDNCYVSSAATVPAFGRFWNIQNESCA